MCLHVFTSLCAVLISRKTFAQYLIFLYGLADQKLCYIQMPLNIEKSGEQDEQSKEWLVNRDTDILQFMKPLD